MQWLEGEMAIKMFAMAVEEGIPMVNIHDAYAVHKVHAGLFCLCKWVLFFELILS